MARDVIVGFEVSGGVLVFHEVQLTFDDAMDGLLVECTLEAERSRGLGPRSGPLGVTSSEGERGNRERLVQRERQRPGP